MRPDLERLLKASLDGLSRPLPSALSIHPKMYTEEEIYRDELDAVFRSNWLSVARSSDIPNAGDWKSVEVMNHKVLLTRDRDGAAHALSPVCRHKWVLVAEGCGNSATLVCPYHKWTYDLAGTLRGAPHLRVDDLPIGQKRLGSYRCEEWLGWIFVNLGGEAEPLHGRHPDIEEVVKPWRLPELVPLFEPLHFEGPYNWKTLCDNVGESYHVLGTHPVSIFPYTNLEGSRWHTDGETWCRSDVPVRQRRREGMVGPGLAQAIDNFSGTWTYNLYPCHIFGLVEDFVVWQRLDVRGAGDLSMELVVLGTPETKVHPAWAEIGEQLRTSVRDIEEEDQRAFRSSFQGQRLEHAEPGPFAQYEEGTWHFQTWWARTMLRHLGRPAGPAEQGPRQALKLTA